MGYASCSAFHWTSIRATLRTSLPYFQQERIQETPPILRHRFGLWHESPSLAGIG